MMQTRAKTTYTHTLRTRAYTDMREIEQVNAFKGKLIFKKTDVIGNNASVRSGEMRAKGETGERLYDREISREWSE